MLCFIWKLKVENGEVSVEAKAIGERGAMLHMEKLIKNSKNSIILYTAWGGTQSELANADALRNAAEKMKRVDYRGRVEILYTAWGGTQSELANADALRNAAEKMKRVDYRGRVEIGATLGSHTGPVYGMGVMDKIR